MNDCANAAQDARLVDDMRAGLMFGGGVLGYALEQATVGAAYHHGAVGAALENCMVARGWRVVSVEEAEGKALAALGQAELNARLSPWVGLDTPYGRIARIWANEAGDGTVERTSYRPEHLNEGQLSLKAAAGRTLASFDRSQGSPWGPQGPSVERDSSWPSSAIKESEIASAPANAAIVVVQLRRANDRTGYGLSFIRMPDGDAYAADNRPKHFIASAKGVFSMPQEKWQIWAVPPGRWKLEGITTMSGVITFCFGGPAFNAGAGDVIFAGAFDLGPGPLGPNLNLDQARAALGSAPAAAKLRPASYVNGVKSLRCAGATNYAYDIEGAPFEPDYGHGAPALNRTIPPPSPTPELTQTSASPAPAGPAEPHLR